MHDRRGLSVIGNAQAKLSPLSRGSVSISGPRLSTGPEHTGSALSDLIAATVVHYYHPAGSCKMSSPSDPLAVVDHHGAVHGVGGLFVVDASIMPTVVSGNTSMPTIVIGEKVGRFISGED
jgi:choline dehydrogenase